MAGAITFKITKNNFSKLNANLIQRIAAGTELAGYGVERTWKQTARVLTGRYKSSIGHYTEDLIKPNLESSPSDSMWDLQITGASVQLYVGTNVQYAADLEARYGTGHNALTTCEGLILESVQTAMGKEFGAL